jgi:hypothetical protein
MSAVPRESSHALGLLDALLVSEVGRNVYGVNSSLAMRRPVLIQNVSCSCGLGVGAHCTFEH